MAGRYIVFGTAGHVDHGKSALVRALTGTDPDRLPEERAREMTLDLGFAFLPLPGLDDAAAIVDVPGHEAFVRNMVAGATGVDAAILVIAADEGVMPQTREHLEVLRQLRVSAGVIALTKVDRAASERVVRVAAEARELVADTCLAGAPVLPVSSVTGEGLEALREELARVAASARVRSAQGPFRLPIDRVFTLAGAGTVVTGTVIAGSLGVADNILCLPQGRELRARSLHVHGRPVPRVFAGQRAAVNLPGIAKEDIERGDVLAAPGAFAPTLMADARLNLSPMAPSPLEQRTRVRVHHGTREVMARVVILEGERLAPGESALVQLRLEAELVAAAGDLFVVRSYSPMLVIGGGMIVDAHPPKRRRGRGADEVAERESLAPAELARGRLEQAGPKGIAVGELAVQLSLPPGAVRTLLEVLREKGGAVEGRQGRWLSAGAVEAMGTRVLSELANLHGRSPLMASVPLAALSAAIPLPPEERECLRLALEELGARGEIELSGERVRLAAHRPQWAGRAAQLREALLRQLQAAGLAAPSPDELAAPVGAPEAECRAILEALVANGELVALAPGITCHPEAVAAARARVTRYLEAHGTMTVPQCRELLGASRKYLIPFLEALDREGVTIRSGDRRRLVARRPASS